VRYLILSDIHANLQALEAVLTDANAIGFDEVLVLGDVVGYGADPSAVLARVLALAPAGIIRGNHDKVCSGLEPPTLFNDVARESAEWTLATLTADEVSRLAGLPAGPKAVAPSLSICHGAPFDEDHYIFDLADASAAIDASPTRICLFGHTHVPAVFSANDDPAQADESAEGLMRLPKTGPALINVGAVGQPRDGDPRAAYGVIDLAAATVQLCRVAYDVRAAQARIAEAGLPDRLAARLAAGR
jgi:predicted phosphodiesterase